MERDFLPQDVTRLIERHKKRLDSLIGLPEFVKMNEKNVQLATNALLDYTVQKMLRDVPLEELNRNQEGIRIKALKDNGYTNIASLMNVSPYVLSNLRGISLDTAYTISEKVADLVTKTRRSVKINISVDRKTSQSTKLVIAIYKYKHLKDQLGLSYEIINKYEDQIKYDIEDSKPGEYGALKWFFTSSKKQQRAIEAYNRLNDCKEYWKESDVLFNAISKIISVTADEAWEDYANNSISYVNDVERTNPGIFENEDKYYGLPDDLAIQIKNQALFPDGLKVELRPYQEWGVKYILHQEKVLLGDEMGLGKTIQAIASMVSLTNTGATHYVVVCPASVLINWIKEIEDKSKLNVIKVHGPASQRKMALRKWMHEGGVAVTTYDTAKIFENCNDFHFSMLVVDEAHYIKNIEAQRSQNVRRLCEQADRLLFMTGTALENRVDEMISLIDVLQPDVARSIQGMEALAQAPEFRKRIAPVYYRRKRDDVIKELPELIESMEWCSLTKEEIRVYFDTLRSKNHMAVRRVSWNIDNVNYSTKARRLKEIVEEAESDGRKVIVFSFFRDTIQQVKELFGAKCTNPITGEVSPERRQEILEEFENNKEKTVLVSQIQAGGTGLNIQAASVVVICEPQQKPSIENQAISRAYRMGQTRDVLVYRLVCSNTIEERYMKILEEKQKIFNAFADKSVAAQESLDNEMSITFGDLIQEEIDRINRENGKMVDDEEYDVESEMDDINQQVGENVGTIIDSNE